MTTSPIAPPPPEAAESVRRLLIDAAYPAAAAAAATDEALPDGLTGVLVQLLTLDLAVESSMTYDLRPLLEAGLVQQDDGWLVPTTRIAVVDGLLIAGDPPRLAAHPDFVAAVSATSRTAASLTVRRSATLGLDLCTGSGVLALLLSRHCERVVATDVAPRALAWAAFNAALNCATIDLRQGSLVDPVEGERFDAVSANPPYVVGLDGDLVYRDSPLPGDGVSELFVRALPALLMPGGWATTTLSWLGADGARPRSWRADATTGGWLLTSRRQGPREHALSWAGAEGDPRTRGERVARWSADLAAAGTSVVSEGALVLHAGPGGWREDDARLPPDDSQSVRIERAFSARDEQLTDSSVLALSADVRVTGGRVVRWGGVLTDLQVDPHTARLLSVFDGRRRLGGLLQEAVLGSNATDDAPVRRVVRDLVDAGVLLPTRSAPVTSERGSPPPVLTADQGRVLATELASTGYRPEALAELLGTTPRLLVEVRDLPVYPLRTPETGLGAVLRLLLLGLPVRPRDLPGDLATALTAVGFARQDGERLVPQVQLVPHGRLLVASDLPAAKDRPDVVVGVQAPTATLADLTPRRPVERALDVGTGCGLQAVLLAEHASHVVATDVNPRAISYAAANAALNGASVELRQGAWFEPVEGEQFDLVVTNPPYVLSPDSRWTFRDGGLPRDGASRLVATQLPRHLRDGGRAVALLSWVDVPGGPPPPLQWSSRQGCDAVLLATGTSDAWETATAWNSDQRDPASYAAEVERWLDWLAGEGISAVEYGALVLHRTGGGSARRVGLPGRPDGPAGEQILRLLEVVEVDPEARLQPASDVTLERELRAGSAGWANSDQTLRQNGGLRLSTSVDEPLARVLGRLTADRSLREAAGDDETLAQVLPSLQRLAAVGLLVRP